MTAVQQDYVHDDETGKWHRKGEEPKEGEKDDEPGLMEKIENKVDDLT